MFIKAYCCRLSWLCTLLLILAKVFPSLRFMFKELICFGDLVTVSTLCLTAELSGYFFCCMSS
jgi:hypothetical protein